MVDTPIPTPVLTMNDVMDLMKAHIVYIQSRDNTIALKKSFNRFIKFTPKLFSGTLDPLEVEQWIKELEKVFKVIECKEDEKVNFILHILQGDADVWWTVKAKEKDIGEHSWEEFKELFLDHYFPITIKEKYIEDFLRLNQGGRIAAEYECEFTRLSRFVPRMTTTDGAKVDRFKMSLHLSIQKQLALLPKGTYAEVLAIAMGVKVIEDIKKKNYEKNRN